MRTDTERLDWLEQADGCALLSDDNGHWAVSGSGSQNVPEGEEPEDIWTTFVVRAEEWRGGIREAIDAAMDEDSTAAPPEPGEGRAELPQWAMEEMCREARERCDCDPQPERILSILDHDVGCPYRNDRTHRDDVRAAAPAPEAEG